MAIDYDTANTGLFTRLGKIVKTVNAHNRFSTLDAELKQIIDPFEASDLAYQIPAAPTMFNGFKTTEQKMRQTIAGLANGVFNNRDVLAELRLASYDYRTFLPALFERMLIDSETIEDSAVTVGTVTAGTRNVGTGTVFITKYLDGYNAPLAGGLVVPSYAPFDDDTYLDSQLAFTETLKITCVKDSSESGVAPGSEVFSVNGAPDGGVFGQSEGSGAGPQLRAIGQAGDEANFMTTGTRSANILVNGSFESTDTATLTIPNWTAAVGVFKYHDAGPDKHGYGGIMDDSGEVLVHQEIDPADIQPGRCYCIIAHISADRLKYSPGDPYYGFVNMGLTSSIYGGSYGIMGGQFPLNIDLSSASFRDSTADGLRGYVRVAAFFVVPRYFPFGQSRNTNDPKLYFTIHKSVAGGGSNQNIFIDDVYLVPATYHGGLGIVICPARRSTNSHDSGAYDAAAFGGDNRFHFCKGDYFTVAITNDGTGVFQEFMRKQFRMQLPSSGSESIADSLAT